MGGPVYILGIETSCDETAAAVVADGREVCSSVVATQVELHAKYGGVVPEIASRAHIERIYPVIAEALAQAGVAGERLDAVAVTNRPGLSIALVVGVTAAKTLSFAWGKPLVAVDHVHAHLYSALSGRDRLDGPAVGLVVSGGHTSLYECSNPLEPRLLGSTIDDAAGEAFDKVATILRLPYPGGPSIEQAAKAGDPAAIELPRSMLGKDSLDFSFSGIKTAVLYHCRGQDMKGPDRVESMSKQEIADIAASFQAAVVDVLVAKTARAVERTGAQTVLLGGGVAANTALRQAFERFCTAGRIELLVAPQRYCTDNAVMVAALGYRMYRAGLLAELSLEARATA